MAMEGHIRAGLLLDAYGALLTQRQKAILGLYYYQDLSLGEIAQQEGISRQGVHDMVRRGVAQMETWEQALGLLAAQQTRDALVERLLQLAEQLNPPEEQQAIVQALLDALHSLRGQENDNP